MLNVVGQLLNIIDRHVLWLYAACLGVILFYLRSYAVARRERTNTSFTIEKEVAVHREGRAMTGIGMMLGVVVLVTTLKFYIVPSVNVEAFLEPEPTNTLPIATLWEPTPSPTPDSTPATPTEAAAVRRTPTPQPTPTEGRPPPTAPPPPPACADPNTSIVSPGMGAVVSGVVAIGGTANHGQFQFYKVEYGIGPDPGSWHVIGDLVYSPVVGGHLASVDTRGLPNGTVWFRLTVVDQSGNYPSPCRVRVTVQN